MEKSGETDFERIKRFAEEQEKKEGFIYCFRGEVDSDTGEEFSGDYVNKDLAGTWYSESIHTALSFLKERENSFGKKGRVFAVIVPASLLTTGRDEIDAARKIINIVNPSILSSRREISRSVVDRLAKSGEIGQLVRASKDKYLSQFGI